MSGRIARTKLAENLLQTRKQRRSKRQRASLEFEPLENRQLLATRIWDGGGADNLWTTPSNWSTDVAPAASDDLQFPANGVRYSPVNDFTSTTFGSITIQDAGYTITGNPLSLTGDIGATYASGRSDYAVDTTLLSDSHIDVATGGSLTIQGVLGDGASSFGITKAGAGTLVLAGDNDYDGGTTIDSGVLEVDGSITSAVVLVGGTLGGSGTVDGSGITSADGGTVAPGPVGGPGILTYANSTGFTMPSGTTLAVDLDGSVVGTGYDQLKLTNGSALFNPNGADLEVHLGYLPTVNTSFQIVSQAYGSPITGRFNGISQFGSYTAGPVTFSVGYFNSGVILTVTSVNTQTSTWDGGGTTDHWSDAANWVGDAVPSPFDSLAFPAGASRPSNTNDLAAGFEVSSITIGAAGYALGGNALDLNGDLLATYGAGTSSVALDLALKSTRAFGVDAGGTLSASGRISGAGFGVSKEGAGTLVLGGSSSNTFTGVTTVYGGSLELNKSAGVDAVGGDLAVGDGDGNGSLKLDASGQVPDGVTVSVAEGSTFDLDGKAETIAALVLEGATVATGSGGTLTLGTSLTTNSSSGAVMSEITGPGTLDLGGDATFSISIADDSLLPVDVRIGATVADGGFVKTGTGTLALSGANTYAGATAVNAGAVQAESDSALGTTAGATTVGSGASVYFSGPGLGVAEGFSAVVGTGVGGHGLLRVVSGDAILSGPVTMSGPISVGAADGATLTINGVIDDSSSSYGLTVANGATGRTVLNGSNLFDGNLVATSGFVRGNNANSFGDPATSSSLVIQSGATLEIGGGITIPSTKTLAISGVPVSGYSKILSVSGGNAIRGDIGITGGNNESFDVANGTTLTASGVISGSVDFDKNGAGTLVLTGTNTNTGNVNVGDGTLLVNGSLATSNSVFVDGILGGTGTLPAVTISNIGRLAPGNSPGILSTGDLTFQSSGSAFVVELDGPAAGTQYDRADVAGTVDLAGATLSPSLGYRPAIGDSFRIIDNDGGDAVSGAFNGLAQGATFTLGNVTFAISYTGGDGNDVVLTVTDVTYTWDGGDVDDSLWSSPDNWVGDVAPTPGSRLFFPSGAQRLSSLNDLAEGFDVFAITIGAAGYTLSGNGIDLFGAATSTYSSGTSTLSLDVSLQSSTTFDVATGGTLVATGAISGTGRGLIKTSGGTLRFEGSSANTYSGTTEVRAGRLQLDRSASVTSVQGDLLIGDNAGSGAAVEVEASDQVANTADVTVNEGASLFIDGGVVEEFTGLTLQGATVSLASGAVLRPMSGLVSNATTNNVTSTIEGAGDFVLQGTLVVTVADDPSVDVDLRISARLVDPTSGTGALAKDGAGTLALSGANTYNGRTYAQAGILLIESNGALGTMVGESLVFDGASMVFAGAGLHFTSRFLVLAGAGVNGMGALRVASGDTTLTGNANLSGNVRFGAASGSTLTLDGILGGTANPEILNGATGRTALGGDNTFSGDVEVLQGFLRVGHPHALGDPAGSAGVQVDSGASLELAGGVTIPATKSLTLVGTGANSGASAKLVNVSGTNAYLGSVSLQGDAGVDVAAGSSLALAGDIGQVGGSRDLTKAGSGTLTLSGTGSFTGVTIIDAGTLLVTGDFSSGPGISVGSGATLGGTGTVGMAVVMSGGTVAPGLSTGVLTTSHFNTTGGSVVGFEIDGPAVGTQYDRIDVVGGVYLYDATLSLSFGYTPPIGAAFTLIDNDGLDAVGGTFAGLPEGATITFGPATYTISYVGGDGNDVVLTVTDVTYTWDGGDVDDSLWSSPDNWVGDVAPTQGARLVFPAGAARPSSVDDLAPGFDVYSITFGAAGYMVGGGSIDLTSGITTTFGAGTVEFDTAIAMAGDEALDIAVGGTLRLGGVLSGTVTSLTSTSGGTLVLAGSSSNTYSGPISINRGTLVLAKTGGATAVTGRLLVGSNASGGQLLLLASDQIDDAAAVDFYNGSTFDLNGFDEEVSLLTLSESSVSIPAGSVLTVIDTIFSFTGTHPVASSIAGAGDLDLGGSRVNFDVGRDPMLAVDLAVSATIRNGGLNKRGGGTLALDAANTYDGSTDVYEGELVASDDHSLGSGAGRAYVEDGASLVFIGPARSIGNSLTIQGTGVDGLGALWVASGSTTLSGEVQVYDDVRVGAASGSTLNLAGVIEDDSEGYDFVIANGASGRTILGGSNIYTGNVTVTQGYLTVTNDDALGDPGHSGTVTIAAGATLELSGGITIPATRSLVLDGIQVDGSSKVMNLDGNNAIDGPILLLDRFQSIDVATGTTLTLPGAIGGQEALDKNGAGTLSLGGPSTLTGQVNVYAGTLVVTGDIGTSGGVQVAGGGTLAGTGTTSAVGVNAGGTIAPGVEAPGTLAVGGLSLAAGALYDFDLFGPTPGSQYDRLNVAGAVALNGSTLSMNIGEGFVATSGQTFTIIDNDGIDAVTGTFAGLPEGAVFVYQGQPFRISYVGGTGNDVVLTSVAIVASPATPVTPTAGSVYARQITASGGSGTGYTFTATGLPAGLSISPGGLISGTPTAANAVPVMVSVTIVDSLGGTTTKTYLMTVNAAIVATPVALPSPTLGSPYSRQITASGGSGTGYTFTATGLPAGLSISPGGLISGTPTSTSPATVLVTITDGDGATTVKAYNVTASRATVTPSLGTTPASSGYGQPVTLTATLASIASGVPRPTGVVRFFLGGTLLGTGTLDGLGVATLATSALPAGSAAITAVYLGDVNYLTGTSSVATRSVSRSGSSSGLASSTASPGLDQPVTLTATIAGQFGGLVGGTVSFFDGATLLGTSAVGGGGVATFLTAGLGTGGHRITAVYSGDPNLAGSTSLAVTVTISQSESNAGDVSSSAPQVFYGQDVILTATFSATSNDGATMTGTVTFYDGDLLLGAVDLVALDQGNLSRAGGLRVAALADAGTVSGQASLPTTALGVGQHVIRAVYSGDANYSSATSETPVSVRVVPTITSTTLAASTTPGGTVLSASVAVTSPGDPTVAGTVSFFDGTTLLGTVPVLGGMAALDLGILAPGPHAFSAVYSGGGNSTAGDSTSAVISAGVVGRVYLDLNADGVPDAGEPGLPGRAVFADLDGDRAYDVGEPITTTDVDGNFAFPNVAPGTVGIFEATSLDASLRYVVDQPFANPDGSLAIGAVPYSPVAPVTVVPNPFAANPPSDPNAAFVQSLYRAVLGRDGGDPEVAGWLELMAAGLTREQVAEGFVNSPEHRVDQVTAYYREFLHRAPDPTSRYWVDALLSGISEESVAESFLTSPEYQASHQDPSLFVRDLYLDVLGRQGEEAGASAWEASLASGMSRQAVVAYFVNSPEAIDRIVEGFYTSYLHRQPDPTSAGWVAELQMPDPSATDVAVGFLSSEEFLEKARRGR